VLSEHGVKISPSTYYEWVEKGPTKRQLADVERVEVIRAQRKDKKTGRSVQTLGARKLWIGLRGQGHDVARCTVEPIMREQGWEGARYGAKQETTDPDPGHDPRPDLVDRNFRAPGRIGYGWRTLATSRLGQGWSSSPSSSMRSSGASWAGARPHR